MDESQGSSGSLPPFLSKIYEMVEDPSTNSVVSWSFTGRSFIVWNSLELSENLLPKYFKHNNFSSFIRQLNTYGFRKIDHRKWEFLNDDFIRGQPQLLKNIHRKKPVHSHSLQNLQTQGNAAPLTELERQSLKDRIERLNVERDSTLVQLQRREWIRQENEWKLQILSDSLQSLELKQHDTVSLLAEAMKEPVSAFHLMPQLDKNDRKRRLRKVGFLDDEALTEANRMRILQAFNGKNSAAASVLISKVELLDQLELSLNFWENIVQEAVCASQSDEISTQELYESRVFSKCPADASIIDADSYPEFPEINMNIEHSVMPTSVPVVSEEQAVRTSPPFPTGYNDVFWQQFLTENPGSSRQAEIDPDSSKCDGGPGDKQKIGGISVM